MGPKNFLRRLGDVLLLASLALLLSAFFLKWAAFGAIIGAHMVLYLGFVLAVIGDKIAKRPFQGWLVLYLIGMWFVLAVLGPGFSEAGLIDWSKH